MAISDKDREEIRQAIAQAQAQSVVGRVEAIVVETLGRKITHLQEVQRDTEAKTEQARKEMASFEERGAQAFRQLAEQKEKLAADQRAGVEAQKVRDALRTQAETKLAELKESVAKAEKAAAEQIEASRKHTEETILEHQRAIDVKAKELDTMQKAAARYKRAVEALE